MGMIRFLVNCCHTLYTAAARRCFWLWFGGLCACGGVERRGNAGHFHARPRPSRRAGPDPHPYFPLFPTARPYSNSHLGEAPPAPNLPQPHSALCAAPFCLPPPPPKNPPPNATYVRPTAALRPTGRASPFSLHHFYFPFLFFFLPFFFFFPSFLFVCFFFFLLFISFFLFSSLNYSISISISIST